MTAQLLSFTKESLSASFVQNGNLRDHARTGIRRQDQFRACLRSGISFLSEFLLWRRA